MKPSLPFLFLFLFPPLPYLHPSTIHKGNRKETALLGLNSPGFVSSRTENEGKRRKKEKKKREGRTTGRRRKKDGRRRARRGGGMSGGVREGREDGLDGRRRGS
jgi:hypothetical protein